MKEPGNVFDFAAFKKKKEESNPKKEEETTKPTSTNTPAEVTSLNPDSGKEENEPQPKKLSDLATVEFPDNQHDGEKIDEERYERLGDRMLIFKSLAISNGDRLGRLRTFVTGRSQNSVENYKELAESYTAQQLIYHFENSNESDWGKKPSFYKAIIQELQKRLAEKSK